MRHVTLFLKADIVIHCHQQVTSVRSRSAQQVPSLLVEKRVSDGEAGGSTFNVFLMVTQMMALRMRCVLFRPVLMAPLSSPEPEQYSLLGEMREEGTTSEHGSTPDCGRGQ